MPPHATSKVKIAQHHKNVPNGPDVEHYQQQQQGIKQSMQEAYIKKPKQEGQG